MLTLIALLIASLPPLTQEREDISRNAASGRARVRGVILDETSDEPVAGTTIRVGRWGPTEILKTDDQGYFESTREFSKGTFRVEAWDNAAIQLNTSAPYTKLNFNPAASSSEIYKCRLDVGRRVELDLTPPAGRTMEDVCALVVRTNHDGSTRTTTVTIHEDDPPWVRIGSWSGTSRDADRLRIATSDGLHAAVLDLDASSPSGARKVDFKPCGILAVRAFGDGGYRSRPIMFQLVRTAQKPRDDSETFTVHAHLTAEAHIQWIPPGEWMLTASSAYFRTTTKRVFVPPLALTRTAIQLREAHRVGVMRIVVAEEVGDVLDWERFGKAPALSATVRSVDGRLQFNVRTTAMCGNGVDALFRREHRGGRFVYEAIVENVPSGEYRVSVSSHRLLDRRAAEIQPDEAATFLYLHETPGDAIGLRVTSGSSGQDVSHYWLLPVHKGPKFPLSARPRNGGLHAIELPGDASHEWFVHSDGFQRAYGSRASFRRAAPPERGLWADVGLKRGYGIRLRAQDPTGTPLPGIAIHFGGELFHTDSTGLTYLSSSKTKPILQLDIEGLQIVGGNVRRDGSFDGICKWPTTLSELRVILE